MHCSALWVIQVTYSINVIKNVCFPSAGNNPCFVNFSLHVARSTPTLYIVDTAPQQIAFLSLIYSMKNFDAISKQHVFRTITLTKVIKEYIEKWRT
jgi:hypothetical protein